MRIDPATMATLRDLALASAAKHASTARALIRAGSHALTENLLVREIARITDETQPPALSRPRWFNRVSVTVRISYYGAFAGRLLTEHYGRARYHPSPRRAALTPYRRHRPRA